MVVASSFPPVGDLDLQLEYLSSGGRAETTPRWWCAVVCLHPPSLRAPARGHLNARGWQCQARNPHRDRSNILNELPKGMWRAFLLSLV